MLARATEPGLVVPLATFAAIGASLVLLGFELALPAAARSAFLFDDKLPAPGRFTLLLGLLAAMLLPCAAALVYRALCGPAAAARLARWSTIASPLVLAFLLPALFDWRFAQRHSLNYLLVLSLFGFALRLLLTRALNVVWTVRAEPLLGDAPLLPRWVYPAALWLGALAYVGYTSYYTILNHRLIGTTAFDLGIYDNLMFNALRGRPFHSPVLFGPGDRSYIAGHAEYAMLLFVPFYAIRPHAETMLILQSAVLGLSAIPLYLLGRVYLSRGAALVLSLAYLGFAPLHGPHFYDFHWLPLAIFFYFWMFYGIATRRGWLAWAGALVLFAMREDIAVTLALFGTFLFLTGLRARFGLVLAALSSVWFVINKFVIMPWAGPWWFENMYSELFADGKPSYGSVITTLITNPVYAAQTFVRSVKLEYGLHMLAPLAFLPLRRAVFVLLLIPGALFTLMTTGYPPSTQIAFQYTTHWIPYLFLAAILGLALTLRERGGAARRSAALIVLAITATSHSYNFGALLQHESFTGGFRKISFEMDDQARERYRALMSLVERIPREASVAATETLNPHISARQEAYAFRGDFGPADYVLLTRYEMSADARRLLNDRFAVTDYGLAGKGADFYLFKKGLKADGTDAALRELGLKVRRD